MEVGDLEASRPSGSSEKGGPEKGATVLGRLAA